MPSLILTTHTVAILFPPFLSLLPFLMVAHRSRACGAMPSSTALTTCSFFLYAFASQTPPHAPSTLPVHTTSHAESAMPDLPFLLAAGVALACLSYYYGWLIDTRVCFVVVGKKEGGRDVGRGLCRDAVRFYCMLVIQVADGGVQACFDARHWRCRRQLFWDWVVLLVFVG